MSDRQLPSFDEATAVRRVDDTSFAADLQASWSSLVGIHGGYTAAVAARAVRASVDDPDKRLRSVSVQFVSPPAPGPVSVELTVERNGRTASFVRARLVQEDRLRLLLSAIVASTRDGIAYDEVPSPLPPTPVDDAGPIFAPDSGTGPGHFANADLLIDPTTRPFSGAEHARIAGWIRPRSGETVTAEWLVCMADLLPPTVFTRLNAPSPAASLDYSVHLLAPDPATLVTGEDWVTTELASQHSTGGYATDAGRIWAPDGTTLAVTNQLRLAG